MVDENTKQQVVEIIQDRKYFTSKTVAKKLNISSHMVGRVLMGMEKEGLIERYSKRQWIWVEN